MSSFGPIQCAPILKAKVWGGRRLAELGKTLPPGERIGESWEIADLRSTSVSGGGGGSAHSTIAHGPGAGGTIDQLLADHASDVLGAHAASAGCAFPLLIKFLDAGEHLSVQTHPSEAYAKAHPDAHLKTESWFVVDAEPGAKIYKGLQEGLTPESFRAHIEDGSVVDDLLAIEVKPGDCFNLPSGEVHALGAGVLVAEIQTPSDTTFRVFDWGRTGRELHVDQALQCIDFANPCSGNEPARFDGDGRGRMIRTTFFEIDQINLAPGETMQIGDTDGPTLVMSISGAGEVCAKTDMALAAPAGMTTLLPAALGSVTCAAKSEARWTALVITLP